MADGEIMSSPSKKGKKGGKKRRKARGKKRGKKGKRRKKGKLNIEDAIASGEKVSIAVKFPGMGPKILDPRLAPIDPVGS